LEEVGKLVRETFDELARADTDLLTGGLQLPSGLCHSFVECLESDGMNLNEESKE
jgi:hypothetical protein